MIEGQLHREQAEKYVLVTGASSGIGLATALHFAANNWNLVMVTRAGAKGRAASNQVRRQSGSNKVMHLTADLASLQQVRGLTVEIMDKLPRLDVLINNAGVMLPAREVSTDGYEMNWAVNHLAPLLIVERLKNWLSANQPASIINVNSEGHRAELFSGTAANIYFSDLQAEKSYSPTRSYSQSKLASLMTSFSQAEHLRGSGVTLNCMHPGMVRTALGRKFSWWLRLMPSLMSTAPERSAACLFGLATSGQLQVLTGRYFTGDRQAEPLGLVHNKIIAQAVWQLSLQQILPFV